MLLDSKRVERMQKDHQQDAEAKQKIYERGGQQMTFLIFSRIFLIGACYGFWLNDDPVIKCVGVFLAIGFGLDLVHQASKNDKVDRY